MGLTRQSTENLVEKTYSLLIFPNSSWLDRSIGLHISPENQ